MKNKWTTAAAVLVALSLTACSGDSGSTGASDIAGASGASETTDGEMTGSGADAPPTAEETGGGTNESETGSPDTNDITDTADTTAVENDPDYCAELVSVSAVTGGGHNLEYTIDEENACAYVSVTYSTDYVPDSALADSVISASAQGGVCRFGSAEGNAHADLTRTQRLTVTDENGAKKTYSIITKRTEGLLPVVNITLDDGKAITDIQRDDTIGMTVSIDCSKAPEYPAGLPEMSGKIRGRGNSTWKWEKKPYKIKLSEKAEVLGLAANKDWILLANYADKSLMRDSVAYDMARELDFIWTPSQYPVDLFINGEYQGVYSIGESMEVGKNRVNITEQSDDSAECGFLLEVGGADSAIAVEGTDYFHTDSEMLNFVTFIYPKPENMTAEQREEIIGLFNKADAAIVSGGDISEFIDIDSFVDWVIIQELTNNTDSAFRRSVFFTCDVGGKIKMGPVWDFDLAFGNYVVDNSSYNSWTIIGSDSEGAFVEPSWGNYLMQNKEFRARLRERWGEVRDRLLSAAMTSIDSYYAKIYPSQEENFNVWRIWDEKPGYSSWANYAANTYELQAEYLKNFLNKRAAWIDENV